MNSIEDFHGDNYVFSNFYPFPQKVDGKTFATNEHFFQASKARDLEEFELVRTCKDAKTSKRLGHEVKMRPDWESVKNEVMLKGLRVKFAIPELRKMLLDTGDAILVEGNTWHDQYWGRCDCTRCGGEGQNWLGRLLMQLRSEIRKEVA